MSTGPRNSVGERAGAAMRRSAYSQTLLRRRGHPRGGDRDLAAVARALGDVERGVGLREQLLAVETARRAEGDADAAPGAERTRGDGKRGGSGKGGSDSVD